MYMKEDKVGLKCLKGDHSREIISSGEQMVSICDFTDSSSYYCITLNAN